MREILYRGIPKSDIDRHFFADIWKDNCEGSFVYGSLIIDKGKYYICVSAMCKINCCINNGMTSMIEVIPETVGQYTGLTDKNGKKIFEGDIVAIDHTLRTYSWDEIPEAYKPRRSYSVGWNEKLDELNYKRNYVVEWKEKDARWILRNGSDQHDLKEMFLFFHNGVIIGNIHNNPDMLKGGGEG